MGIVDLDPRIHLSVITDPDPVPRIHIWKKWIQIRVQSGSESEYLLKFMTFVIIKKFMYDKLIYLFLLPPKFRKSISQITKTLSFTFCSTQFWLVLILPGSNKCFLKCIRILIRAKKSKWIRIQSGDLSGSRSGQNAWIRIRNDVTNINNHGLERLRHI